MFKKIPFWILPFFIVIFIIILIFYGAVLREALKPHKSKYFPYLHKATVFIAEIPKNLMQIRGIAGGEMTVRDRFNKKGGFKILKKIPRDEILLLSRYDGDIKQSVVEIIDLQNFKTIHIYKPNFKKINEKVNTSNKEFVKNNITNKPSRFRIHHPIISNNLDIIFHSENSPFISLNKCGNINWINQDDSYHHSVEIDEEGNYWTPSYIYPYELNKFFTGTIHEDYLDDGISKISKDGKTLYKKSLSNILIENDLVGLLFGINEQYYHDPLHLNDIQPALEDGNFWRKGDLFLSIRNRSLIVLYRPETNKIIKLIWGPFSRQHDIDIISKDEISIFDNNNVSTINGNEVMESSEVLIFNFKENSFTSYLKNSIAEQSVLSGVEGLQHLTKDNSLLIEDNADGRILFFSSSGELLWEYVNKAKDGKIYRLNWSRLIEEEEKIKLIKQNTIGLKCS